MMRFLCYPLVLLGISLSTFVPYAWAVKTPPPDGAPSLLHETLSATGRQETILTVARFGRYAVIAESPQGTGLQLIDRLTGPGPVYGRAGEQDGRWEGFLERGAYKIAVYSHKAGKGVVKLEVRSFEELHLPKPPRLVSYKIVDTQLRDFQQRSYWIEIDKRRQVIIEAAGRCLQDLRLWKNGDWLVDHAPQKISLLPHTGQPLNACRIAADLNPGLYLLTAYGGPPAAWAVASDEQPLYIRMGIPELSVAGRSCYKASPFGLDRYRVPASANFYQLSLPQSEAAGLMVCPYNENDPFSDSGNRKKITKESRLPVVDLTVYSNGGQYNLVTVQREAGKAYVLQYFQATRSYPFSGTGNYWISTLHSGYGEDTVDATALLFERPPNEKEHLIDNRAIAIDRDTVWHRRFNLLKRLTLYLEIKAADAYIVEGQGAGADYRIEPFLLYKPKDYEKPAYKKSGGAWDLEPGFYVLTVKPHRRARGIVDLSIYPRGGQDAGQKSPSRPSAAQIATRFDRVRLKSRHTYRLYLNQQPEVKSGVVLRQLPIDLTDDLPVTQQPGETVNIEIRLPGKGKIAAVTEDGRTLDIRCRGRKIQDQLLTPATYTVEIRNPAEQYLHYNLSFIPEVRFAQTPLPPVSESALAKLPQFQVLDPKTPVYVNAARQEKRSFKIVVAHPALYRLETTGLLETQGTLRTRTLPLLDRQSKNGVGRNFLIQQYLREGTYQLTTQPRGETHGPMGVQLAATPLQDGGMLMLDTPARFSLTPGNGLKYRFKIAQPGNYRYRAMGLRRRFQIRLEDGDGWPVVKPGQAADITQWLAAGDYQVIILPSAVNARVVSLLEGIPEAVEFSGHGPHRLTPSLIGKQIDHRWMEPAAGMDRISDKWCFTVPARLDATIQISLGMAGHLIPLDNRSLAGSYFKGGKSWSHTLAQGEYCLAVQSIKPNNRFDYGVNIQFKQLVKGFRRNVRAPAAMPFSVGEEALVELTSFGRTDVRARLFDEHRKRLIAQADDQLNDWNFNLSCRLKPGFYQLLIEPVGERQAETTVTMSAPAAVTHQTKDGPARMLIEDNQVHRIPLAVPEGYDLLLVTATCRDNLAISLEKKQGGDVHTVGRATGKQIFLGQLLDRQTSEKDYELVIQRIDQRRSPIQIALHCLKMTWQEESDLVDDGVPLEVVNGDVPVGYAGVRLTAPGVFQVADSNRSLLWSHPAGRSFQQTDQGQIVSEQPTLCFLTRLEEGAEGPVKATRVRLSSREPLQMNLPQGRQADLDIASNDESIFLLLASSRTGQPGIVIDREGGNPPCPALIGVSDRSAVNVRLDAGDAKAKIWNAGEPDAPLSLTVQKIAFDDPVQVKSPPGIRDFSLKPRSAVHCFLRSGMNRLRLSLPPHTAAVLIDDKVPESVHWSGAKPLCRQIDTLAGQLLLLHCGDADATAGFSYIPLDRGRELKQLDSRLPLKHYFPATGSLSLTIPTTEIVQGDGLILHVSGPGACATAVLPDGRIRGGNHLPVAPGAIVHFHCDPGLLIAWLAGGSHDPWQPEDAPGATVVNDNSQVALQGESMTVQLTNSRSMLLHLKTDFPVVVLQAMNHPEVRPRVFPAGAWHHLLAPGEGSRITLWPAGQGRLGGSAEFLFSDILQLNEGLGPKLMLAPGNARLFTFELDHDGLVGVGVRGTADIAECRLMDIEGRLLEKGVVAMRELKKGRYLLQVSTPLDSFPLELQPAVVGLTIPGEGPSAETIRKYMQMAGLKTDN